MRPWNTLWFPLGSEAGPRLANLEQALLLSGGPRARRAPVKSLGVGWVGLRMSLLSLKHMWIEHLVSTSGAVLLTSNETLKCTIKKDASWSQGTRAVPTPGAAAVARGEWGTVIEPGWGASVVKGRSFWGDLIRGTSPFPEVRTPGITPLEHPVSRHKHWCGHPFIYLFGCAGT